TAQYSKQEITIEQTPGSLRYDIHLPCGIKLNFFYIAATQHFKNSLWSILNSFDIDLCQVGYTGKQLVSTFAFLQAVATKSFIVYSLHGGITKNVFIRIEKYSKRGFTLLEPTNFDGNFTLIMKKPIIPLYRVEHRNFIDDDGEIQTETVEYWRQPARNVDTFNIQERFIAVLSS
ncbi:unnamed protein product, partial [Adineta ricciae]